MLAAAVDDLARHGRTVFGVAPTAKAAHVFAGTRMATDTVAKLLHEWRRDDRPPDPRYRLSAGSTVVVDEAGMIGTRSLHQLIDLADQHRWRLVLVGEPRQLQAVGRGGMFTELCATSRVHELARVHRFTHPWEAEASLQLRVGDPAALDNYEQHDRIRPGVLEIQLGQIAAAWVEATGEGRTVAVTASSNQHVDALNDTIQQARLDAGHLDPAQSVPIGGGERAHVGEIVVTRRNERQLATNHGETVRNRDRWTVTATRSDGALTVTRPGGGTVILPVEYVAEHVRLGYAATEHGHQGDTVDIGFALTSAATTHRGLYVAAIRGRDENRIHVLTGHDDPGEARDLLEGALAHDRADLPAVTQRRRLATLEPAPLRHRKSTVVPDWIAPWLRRLHDDRQTLLDRIDEHQQQRIDAVAELQALQPVLAEARAAWEPYARPIRNLEQRLETELRPAMWRANHDARQAGFGHRRHAERVAADTRYAVDQAQAAIAAIRAEGGTVKQHLDQLQRRDTDLRRRGEPGQMLDSLDRRQLHQLDQILDAAHTYTNWLDGQPTASTDLAQAVDTLTTVARHAPAFATDTVDRNQWNQLLALAPHNHLDRSRPTPEIDLW